MALIFVQLMANASLLARSLGPRMMVAVYAGFTLFVYFSAISGRHFAARRAVGWVSAPWRSWIAAVAIGSALAVIITAVTLAFRHPIRVMEPFDKQVLALTLGPILEEICIRGVLLSLLARVIGSTSALLLTSGIFAGLHLPASPLKLATSCATGTVYGGVNLRSGSTALAAIAHATYNLTLVLFGLYF